MCQLEDGDRERDGRKRTEGTRENIPPKLISGYGIVRMHYCYMVAEFDYYSFCRRSWFLMPLLLLTSFAFTIVFQLTKGDRPLTTTVQLYLRPIELYRQR